MLGAGGGGAEMDTMLLSYHTHTHGRMRGGASGRMLMVGAVRGTGGS